MSQLSSKRPISQGKIFPENQLSAQEKARFLAEDEVFAQQCHVIFERVQPELMQDYYDWFIVIEPETGEYFIDQDDRIARKKAHQKHPHKKCLIMGINETGTCGRI